MRLKSAKPRLSRQQQLSSRPFRLVSTSGAETSTGGLLLSVPMQRAKWFRWLLPMPAGATKTFELDSLGRFVWEACEGRATLQQIARRLAKAHDISDREAQVATEEFLRLLARRGLIGISVQRQQGP